MHEPRLFRVTEQMKSPPRWAALHVLAEDDWGDLYLPCNHREHRHPELWWDRKFNRRNPLHWRFLALTWITGWIVMVDSEA